MILTALASAKAAGRQPVFAFSDGAWEMKAAHLNFHLVGFNPPLPGQVLLLSIKEKSFTFACKEPDPMTTTTGFHCSQMYPKLLRADRALHCSCLAGLNKFKLKILLTTAVLLG